MTGLAAQQLAVTANFITPEAMHPRLATPRWSR